MTDFVDSCVVISYFNPNDDNHTRCKKFIRTHPNPLFITYKTYLEIMRTIKEKVNRAIIIILKHFKKTKFTSDKDQNLVNIKNGFKAIKKKNENIKNFLDFIEEKSIEFINRGATDLNLLIDWASEIDIEINVKIEEIVGRIDIEKFDRIIKDYEKDRKASIKKAIADIHFQDDNDEAIFYELAVKTIKYSEIRFFTFDTEFIKKANKAASILVDEDIINKGQLKFCEIN